MKVRNLDEIGMFGQERANYLMDYYWTWWSGMACLKPQELLDMMQEVDDEATTFLLRREEELIRKDPEYPEADFMTQIGIMNRCRMEAMEEVRQMYVYAPLDVPGAIKTKKPYRGRHS